MVVTVGAAVTGTPFVAESVAPGDHVKLNAPEAVSVVLPPMQKPGGLALPLITGEGKTVITEDAVFLHPLAAVPSTV